MIRKTIITLFGVFILINNLYTQDNNYWTQQFGAKATLLAGSKIAGVQDNSAIFYNPGALCFIENPGLSVNANAYSIDLLKIENGAGSRIDMNSSLVNFFPQLISGIIKLKKSEKINIGYALLTKQKIAQKFNLRHEMYYDVIPLEPGNEEFIGTFELETSASELWPGICFSYKISEIIGIGISQFVNYRSQSHRHSVFARAIPTQIDPLSTDFYVAIYNLYENFSLDNISILWKPGIALNFGKMKIGFTYTSPSVNIFGLGSVQREISLLNLADVISDTINVSYYTDLLAMDRQINLSTRYKSPQSLGFGLEYFINKLNFSFASEYFFKVPVYTVISAKDEPFSRPGSYYQIVTDNSKFLNYQTYAESIMNFAFGIEYKLKNNISILAGYRTDYNSFTGKTENYKNFEGILSYPTKIDLFHYSLGISFERKKNNIITGINYMRGKNSSMKQFINFTEADDVKYMLGPVDNSAVATMNSFSLVIGYLYRIK